METLKLCETCVHTLLVKDRLTFASSVCLLAKSDFISFFTTLEFGVTFQIFNFSKDKPGPT